MDAAAAADGWNEEKVRLLNMTRHYAVMIYVTTIITSLVPRLAAKFLAPDAVRVAVASTDPSLTILAFAATTILLQFLFAMLLERKAARAPKLGPLGAWTLAVCTWASITSFFLEYFTVGDLGPPMSRADWALAGVASAVNLAMAVRTVSRHLA